MKATTIKVEGELLADLERTKPASETLTGHVRTLLRAALAGKQMAEAADRYAELLEDAEEERAWLRDWDAADLGQPPRRKRR